MGQIVLLAAIVAVGAIVVPAMAVDYMVGDDRGWSLGVNYSDWVQGKEIYVGDTLTFMYNASNHDVLEVNGPDIQVCNTSNQATPPLNSGNDKITLTSAGKKWYICSRSNHCSQGLKLVVKISEAPAPIQGMSPMPATPCMSPMPAIPGMSPMPGTPGMSPMPVIPAPVMMPAMPPMPSTPGTSPMLATPAPASLDASG